jgi:hypothetical protein
MAKIEIINFLDIFSFHMCYDGIVSVSSRLWSIVGKEAKDAAIMFKWDRV